MTDESLRAQAARIVAKHRAAEKQAKEAKEKAEALLWRRQDAFRLAAGRLLNLLREIGLDSIGINVCTLGTGIKASEATAIGVYAEEECHGSHHWDTSDYDFNGLITFGVGWDAECHKVHLTHDDTPITDEIAAGIVLDTIEKHQKGD